VLVANVAHADDNRRRFQPAARQKASWRSCTSPASVGEPPRRSSADALQYTDRPYASRGTTGVFLGVFHRGSRARRFPSSWTRRSGRRPGAAQVVADVDGPSASEKRIALDEYFSNRQRELVSLVHERRGVGLRGSERRARDGIRRRRVRFVRRPVERSGSRRPVSFGGVFVASIVGRGREGLLHARRDNATWASQQRSGGGRGASRPASRRRGGSRRARFAPISSTPASSAAPRSPALRLPRENARRKGRSPPSQSEAGPRLHDGARLHPVAPARGARHVAEDRIRT